jgi:flagellar basal-body rod protein FlgC
MHILDTLHISASGMTAQRVRLQTISSNLANARSTKGIGGDGEPYRRQMPVFQAIKADPFGSELTQKLSRVSVVDVKSSQEPFKQVFDPGHPDADADGFVKFPNVDILREMVDLMVTSRSYDANTNSVETACKMANQALMLGK